MVNTWRAGESIPSLPMHQLSPKCDSVDKYLGIECERDNVVKWILSRLPRSGKLGQHLRSIMT